MLPGRYTSGQVGTPSLARADATWCREKKKLKKNQWVLASRGWRGVGRSGLAESGQGGQCEEMRGTRSVLGPGQRVSGSTNLVARLGRLCGVRGVRAPSLARHKGAALRQPPPFHHLCKAWGAGLSRPLSALRRASSRPVPWRGNKEEGFQCWGKRSGAPQDDSPDPGPPRRVGADGGRSRARSHATFLLPHRVYSDEDRGLDMARGERTPPKP